MEYYLKKTFFSKIEEVGLGRIQIWMPRILQPVSSSYYSYTADLQASPIEKPKTPLLIFYSTPKNGIGTHVSWYSVES